MIDAIICSPPYADSVNSQQHGIDWTKMGPSCYGRKRGPGTKHEKTFRDQLAYGGTIGQIGALSAEDFKMFLDAIVCSPPFLATGGGAKGVNTDGYGDGKDQVGKRTYQGAGGEREPGNIETLPEGEAMEVVKRAWLVTDWRDCYDQGWKGLIVPDAFAHPAKFSYGLVHRIFSHGLAMGYWKPGQTVGDPFGGVALGGILAGYSGLNWIGVELEPRFQRMGDGYDCPGMTKQEWVRFYGRWQRGAHFCPDCQKGPKVEQQGIIPHVEAHHYTGNLDLHRRKWEVFGQPDLSVKLIQGDSRRFAELVGEVAAVVSSPPFLQEGGADSRLRGGFGAHPSVNRMTPGASGSDYGTTPGQIGRLPAGDLAGVVTSPPYAESIGNENKIDYSKAKDPTTSRTGSAARDAGSYGQTPGNIGNLPAGQIDGVITSPPYAESVHGGGGCDDDKLTANKHTGPNSQARNKDGYWDNPKNIGNDSGETYWQAVAQVYAQCRLAMKPGGIMALVVKDYVKNKKRVPLCDQTAELLTRLGFTVFERCRCWLVKEREHTCLFDGPVKTRKERKSFFRRLAEKKGSPRIDFEEVIWCRR